MIKRTVGNTQQVVVPLYTRTLHEDGTVSVEAYTPSADDVVTASLAGKRVYNYPTTIGEGCIIFSIIGVEVADVYALRVLVVRADGSRLRYYTRNAIELTHETIEDDEQGAEFTASGIVLDAAYYLFAKGDKGDTGNGIDRIELTRTSIDGKHNTYTIYYTDGRRYSYTIDNGEDGKGIDHIAKTATEGLVDTYTIYYTDGTTSTYQVTNGQGGGTVDAYTKAESDAKFAKVNDATQDIKARGIRVDVLSFEDGSLNTSNGNLIYDGDKVLTEGDAVPLSRKVNGQPLTADVTLDGSNINATLGEATIPINNVIEAIAYGINGKQDTLVSGESIKTINGESILGEGNIEIQGGVEEIYIGTGTPPADAKIAINPDESFVSIEQTTGDSTTSVMSQKAVTDAIAGAGGGGEWTLSLDTTIDALVGYIAHDFGKSVSEIAIFMNGQIIDGSTDAFAVYFNTTRPSGQYVKLTTTSAQRGYFAHIAKFGNLVVAESASNLIASTIQPSQLAYNSALTLDNINSIVVMPASGSKQFAVGTTIKIYAK